MEAGAVSHRSFYFADIKYQAGGNLTRIADFSLTPVIDMNWLVRLFWALFEAIFAMSLPQRLVVFGGLGGKRR